jgi:hypothetical protein
MAAACASTRSSAGPIASTTTDASTTRRDRWPGQEHNRRGPEREAARARWTEGEEGGTSKILRVVGLLLNFGGIVLLFLFEMAFRVASGSKTVAWTAPSIDVQVRKLDDIYTVLGWIGLLTLVLGTLLQILAALPRRW